MKNTIAILTLLANIAATGFAPAKSPVIEPAPNVKLRVEKFRSYYRWNKMRVTYYADGVLKGKKQKEETFFFDNGILSDRTDFYYCGTKDNIWNVAVTAGGNSNNVRIDSHQKLKRGLVTHSIHHKKPPDIYKQNATDIPSGLLDGGYNLDNVEYDISLSPDGKSLVISITNVSGKSIKVNARALRNATLFFKASHRAIGAASHHDCDCCNPRASIVRVLAPQKTIRHEIVFAELFDEEPQQKENIEKQIELGNRSWFKRHRELSIDFICFTDIFFCPAWAKEASTFVRPKIHLGTVTEFAERNPEVFNTGKK